MLTDRRQTNNRQTDRTIALSLAHVRGVTIYPLYTLEDGPALQERLCVWIGTHAVFSHTYIMYVDVGC